jgi:hypothetical protein
MKGSVTQSIILPSSFEELARMMVPHVIVDYTDYQNTVEMLNRLAVRSKLTAGQRQYLETLVLLVEAYDRQHSAIDVSSITSIDLLKSLLRDHGMSASDLGRLLGNKRTSGSWQTISSSRQQRSWIERSQLWPAYGFCSNRFHLNHLNHFDISSACGTLPSMLHSKSASFRWFWFNGYFYPRATTAF